MKKRIRFIGAAAEKYVAKLWLMLLIILVTTYIVATFPRILGKLVDILFYDGDRGAFLRIILVYIVLFAVNQCLHFALEMLRADLSAKFIYDIKRRMFRKVLSYRCDALTDMKSGDVVSRINHDADEIMSLFYSDIFYGISAVFDFGACMAMMLTANVLLALVAMLLAVVSFLAAKYFSGKMKPFQKEIGEASAENRAWLFEVLGGMRDIRLLGAAGSCIGKYLKKDVGLARLEIRKKTYEVKAEKCNSGIQTLCTVSLYAVSAILIGAGALTVGGMVACIDYFSRMVLLLERISRRFITLPERLISVDRVIAVWDVESEDYRNDSEEIPVFHGNVDVQHVSFSYDGETNVLEDISFRVRKGEKVAIVGKSGEGKSTMANLLCRFYEPRSGVIRMDGRDIRSLGLGSLRRQIGIMHQETILFDGTIRYNLIFSDSRERDHELWEALKKVQLYDFVSGLGLDAPVGVEGSFLSGGQRQRLAMARLILRKPAVVIFDESTSSLDNITEREVIQNWNEIFRNTTMLIIAHRFSTIRSADRILCLQNGRIAGDGTHGDLLLHCEPYQELYHME